MHSSGKKPEDALETISLQDGIISDMLDDWLGAIAGMEGSREENVKRRWEAGSAVKLLVQHAAVREEAVREVRGRLEGFGVWDLAARLDGNGHARRQAIGDLDKLVRSHEAIELNTPEIQESVLALNRLARVAIADDASIVPDIERALGPPGERSLPADLSVRLRSTTHPSPEGKWWERWGPVHAVTAFYAHLRLSPKGLLSPKVDKGREHLPGPGS